MTMNSSAHPLESAERLVLLDALRGFALCGVFVSNVFMWFSGRALRPREQLEALAAQASPLDTVSRYLDSLFVSGKSVTLFSFLFGLGFAVLLWHGDILTVYALLGFTLLLFRRGSDRALLLWASALIFLVPLCIAGLQRLPAAWRSLTYGKAQSMRRAKPVVQALLSK